MSVLDSLRTMTYISPSGVETVLSFDSLERSSGKKAPLDELPNQDIASVQDLGEATLNLPTPCYVSGDDYHEIADRFWKSLEESGPGKLVHPRWGNINVLPSSRSQKEEFVNGIGRAVFEILFLRTDKKSFEYPLAADDTAAQTESAVDDADTAITASVPSELDDTRTKAGLKENIQKGLGAISGTLNKITGLTEDITSEIDQTVQDVTDEIDALVQAPADLMSAMLTLYRLPARSIVDIKAKVDGYRTIYSSLISGFEETTEKYGETFGLITAGNLNAVAIAAAEATTAGNITTRDEAGYIVGQLSGLLKDIKYSVRSLEDAGGFDADYDSQQATAQAGSAALNNLINSALNLPAERVITLDRSIPPNQLVFELTGSLERMEELMEYNGLIGDEIFMLPVGRVWRWYE